MKVKFDNSVVREAAVVSVQGRVDGETATLLEAHCKKHLADTGRKSLVIDLSAVDYLSSAGLRSVLILGKHVKALGGKQAICGLKGVVRETFTISGFLQLFPAAETPDQAATLTESKSPGASAPPKNR